MKLNLKQNFLAILGKCRTAAALLTTVTGCLKMDAVCRIGGTSVLSTGGVTGAGGGGGAAGGACLTLCVGPF